MQLANAKYTVSWLLEYFQSRNHWRHQKKFFLIYLYLIVLGLHCCWQVSSVAESWELQSSWNAQASHYGGLFCSRAQALDVPALVVATCWLNSCGSRVYLPCSMWDSSQTWDGTCVLHVGRWILNHWTHHKLLPSISIFITSLHSSPSLPHAPQPLATTNQLPTSTCICLF